MPNLQSAKKRVRSDLAKRRRNDALRSKMRTFIKKTIDAIEEGKKEEVCLFIRKAISYLDRSVKKGIVHKNYANRHKASLSRKGSAFLLNS